MYFTFYLEKNVNLYEPVNVVLILDFNNQTRAYSNMAVEKNKYWLDSNKIHFLIHLVYK